MSSLPMHVIDEILFRSSPKSLATMRCSNKSIEARVSNDPNFKSEYLSRVESSLLHISREGSKLLCFHPSGDSRPFQNKAHLETSCHILGYCSGLLLLVVNKYLCVANPLTKKYRFLDLAEMKQTKGIGFVVDQVDQNTQRFKIVCIMGHFDFRNPARTTYGFEIYAGRSWRLSSTTITCASSDLMMNMNPVYVEEDRALYWLRADDSILAFNLETEKARLIPIKFNRETGMKLLFGSGDNRLTLIAATKEVISVFVLENILTADPKWILERQIRNEAVQESVTSYWNVVAFDGRCLVVRTMTDFDDGRMVYGYDLRTNKWGVVGSMPSWCDGMRYFCQYKPSWSSVMGLVDKEHKNFWYSMFTTDKSDRSVESIMDLINRNF